MLNVRILSFLLLTSVGSLGSTVVQGADLKAGKTLHDAHCLQCHDSGVYSRADRKVTSLDGLRKQVQRCDLSLGLTWFDDQVEDVAQYLNSSYYHFK